jgi:hypothetical protein
MIFILFLIQISFFVCENNSIEQKEGHMFVNCLIQFCKDYFGGRVVIIPATVSWKKLQKRSLKGLS